MSRIRNCLYGCLVLVFTSVAVFSPSNEPYLGRESVYAFDNLIVECLSLNNNIAPSTHGSNKTELQIAACQLIPQSTNIALSIRELVRQGYLFGAYVLVRPLVERVAILLYLKKFPDDVVLWLRGWQHSEAPSLAKMIDKIGTSELQGYGRKITSPYNSILHGKPDSAIWSIIPVNGTDWGHAPSKILNNPRFCDDVCLEASGWLAICMCVTSELFTNS